MADIISENLRSRAINDLINGFDGKKCCFVVPSYQRGYRWTSSQIKRLLDDLYEFGVEFDKRNQLVGEYYCLQPIVVRTLHDTELKTKLGYDYSIDDSTNYYEIVDGQQRMTTVYILLKCLLRDVEPFDIRFERDKEKEISRHKLLSKMYFGFVPSDKDKCYADAYYFVCAYDSIKEWLVEKKNKTGKSNIASYIENIICERTKVIWYELKSDSNCYDIFKNINHGKIPLTDAELVKAMLLNSRYYVGINGITDKSVEQEQNRYARLWDEIQREFNDERMWSFITGGGNINIATRIDFLIRLITLKDGAILLDESDYKYFSYYENNISSLDGNYRKKYVESIFESLRNSFRTIQDWYNNYQLHNYIGFILCYSDKYNDIDVRINTIIELMLKYECMSKTDFIKDLKDNKIKIMFNKYDINDINYEDNRESVEKLLMLFNIEELNLIGKKFDFTVDKEGWSIEHIKAQHSEITQEDKIKDYLEKEKESLSKLKIETGDSNLVNMIDIIVPQIEAMLTNPVIDANQFKQLAEKIDINIDKFDSTDMHRMGNLALISKTDNSSLGNVAFYKKREKINQWLSDRFKNIPYSTKKAFIKMYSTQAYSLDYTRWRKSDFEDMFTCQKKVLKDYIKGC